MKNELSIKERVEALGNELKLGTEFNKIRYRGMTYTEVMNEYNKLYAMFEGLKLYDDLIELGYDRDTVDKKMTKAFKKMAKELELWK